MNNVFASRVIFLVLTSALFIFSGCSTISYYGQAIKGQCQLLFQKKSIPDILEENNLDSNFTEKLNFVLDIRKFAKDELDLPVGNSYLHYVDLKRPYVVWNVFACSALSLTPKSWYYPIVGRVTYRGYFKEETARTYAETLKKEGLDVYVSGITAYSTLGWFNDPITNVMLRRGEERLAELIFHELAHQVLYIKDDTSFNESFATAVAQAGVKIWLEKQQEPDVFPKIIEARKRHQAFVDLVLEYRDKLESVYASAESDDIKLMKKKTIIQELKNQYQNFKAEWHGYEGYDYWFSLPINNAQLSTVSTYHDFVPSFIALLEKEQGDFTRFYESCKALGKLEKDERHKALVEISNR